MKCRFANFNKNIKSELYKPNEFEKRVIFYSIIIFLRVVNGLYRDFMKSMVKKAFLLFLPF